LEVAETFEEAGGDDEDSFLCDKRHGKSFLCDAKMNANGVDIPSVDSTEIRVVD
jgi:hypothetical protein